MGLMELTKNIHKHYKELLLSALMVFSYSCQDITQAEKQISDQRSSQTYGDGDGLVYLYNPSILQGNLNLLYHNWSGVLTSASITDNFYLNEKCTYNDPIVGTVTSAINCLEVRNDVTETASVQKTNNSWTFDNDSDEFYQVNTFYHVKKIQNRFLESLSNAQAFIHSPDFYNVLPPSIPSNIGETGAYWWNDLSNSDSYLTVFSKCYIEEINSYFDPSAKQICLGWNTDYGEDFRMAQDPSVIYHEMGHTFVKVMMNLRNSYKDVFTYTTTDFKSELGELSYDEAGALNEGIADYFSYYITNRKHIGEWAMARFSADRPMVETDDLHAGRIPAKLSYPEYLHYNAVTPEDGAEDIHFAGQIISHYLVGLTQSFKDSCFASSTLSSDEIHEKANDYTVMLLSETLAEIGDMTATGSDFLSEFYINNTALSELFFTNLNNDESYLWAHQVTPPNFRRFFKIFGKNINQYISDYVTGTCPAFTRDDSETLLDEYGLLLFKSYDDAGKGISYATTTPAQKTYSDFNGSYLNYTGKYLSAKTSNTEVNESNRKNSVLISKDYIDISTSGVSAILFDNQTYMSEYVASLTFEGRSIDLSTGLAGTEYNNGNVKISPGEVIGLSLNLVNNSNSTMAGVQILANDWDHMKLNSSSSNYVNKIDNITNNSNQIATWEPCQIQGWPLVTEGGVLAETNPTQGDCGYTTRSNKVIEPNQVATSPDLYEPKYDLDAPQPICTVQYSDENESKWVSQDFYRTYALDLEDKECLNNSPTGSGTGVEFNPNECLIRMLPGANQAILGKIDPQKTWSETLSASKGGGEIKYLPSTMVVMEVNKWIQPGTTFNCRFRARFTNCVDCFNDNNSGDDYSDYEYAGQNPFKVINFSFTVID